MTTLELLFRHDNWANRLILHACQDLTPRQLAASVDGTYGELGATLAHLVAAEDTYVHRLTGQRRRLEFRQGDAVPHVAKLIGLADATGPVLLELAATLDPERVVEFTRDDGVHRARAGVILVQGIDHGREHRTHAATILTRLGIAPPDMDGWAFGEWQEASAQSG